MSKLGAWIEKRRKSVGLTTQMDLAVASKLSLKTIQDIESSGVVDSRKKSTMKLIADALRVSERDFERLAKGEIDDAPFTGATDGLGFSAEVAAAVVKWMAAQARDTQLDFLSKTDPADAWRVGQLLVEWSMRKKVGA